MINTIKKFKPFFLNEKLILILILCFAYLIRVLPYNLGYNLPLTDDAMLDYSQVKYIEENGSIDFFDLDQDFGSFPILHLLVYFLSLTGVSSLKIFLFIPQLLPVIGLFFYYLFLKNYFSNKVSLLSTFLIAVFIPSIYWGSQPVRETVGLFFFPLVIYLLDLYFRKIELKRSILYWTLLVVALGLLVFTHHWSSLMTFIWMVTYPFLFLDNKKYIGKCLLLASIFIVSCLAYWFVVFQFVYTLLRELSTNWVSFILLAVVFVVFLSFIRRYHNGLSEFKTKNLVLILSTVLFLFFFYFVFYVAPTSYSLPVLFAIALYLIFINYGFFFSRDQAVDRMVLFAIPYFGFLMVGLVYSLLLFDIRQMVFDPFRIIEFIIFPLSAVASVGLKQANKEFKFLLPVVGIVLVGFSVFAYPSKFIFGTNLKGSIFYDVRSDIRFLSSSERELIDWANNHNIKVYSPRPEVLMYQRVFGSDSDSYAYLVSESELSLFDNYSSIKDSVLKIKHPAYWAYTNLNEDLMVIRNKDSYLVSSAQYSVVDIDESGPDVKSIFVLQVIQDMIKLSINNFNRTNRIYAYNLPQIRSIEILELNGRPLFHDLPKSLEPGELYESKAIFENTGTITWKKDEVTLIELLSGSEIGLKEDVGPGQRAVFTKKYYSDNNFVRPRELTFRLRLRHKTLGEFGTELFIPIMFIPAK